MSIGSRAKQRQDENGVVTAGIAPKSGPHVIAFDEGIGVYFSEGGGFWQMRFPLVISEVDTECPNAKWSVFISANEDYKDMNENQLADLLGAVGMAEKYDAYLSSIGLDPEVPIPDNEEALTKIVNGLNTQLPTKSFEAIIEVVKTEKVKDGETKTYTNVRFRKLGPIGCGIVEGADSAVPVTPTSSPDGAPAEAKVGWS